VQILVGHLFSKMIKLYGMAATLNQGYHSEPDIDCQNSTEVQKRNSAETEAASTRPSKN
jgi:hypothetical protein